MSKEYIYIFTNSKREGFIKVGKTKNNPNVRADQLSRQTASIGVFEVVWYMEVPDSSVAEKMTHYLLKDYHEEKEYFRINPIEAIDFINDKILAFFELEESAITKDTELFKKYSLIQANKRLKEKLNAITVATRKVLDSNGESNI